MKQARIQYTSPRGNYLADISKENGEIALRWRINNRSLENVGWCLVGFFVVGVGILLTGIFTLNVWYIAYFFISTIWLVMMSRLIVSMMRPRLSQVLSQVESQY